MALNKDTLGTAIYNALNTYNNKSIGTLGDIEAARLSFCKTLADEIIKHLKNNIEITIPGTGLTAGATAVTGAAITGSIN